MKKGKYSIYDLSGIISDISERCWWASWEQDIEFFIWSLVEKFPDIPEKVEYGSDYIYKSEIAEIKKLAELLGGFWTWVSFFPNKRRTKLSDGRFFTPETKVFVPLCEWKDIYEVYKKSKKDYTNK